jgi:hypothetical protein
LCFETPRFARLLSTRRVSEEHRAKKPYADFPFLPCSISAICACGRARLNR